MWLKQVYTFLKNKHERTQIKVVWAENKTQTDLTMARIMFVIFLMSLNSVLTSPDTADADTNSGSETSDTGDIDMGLDNKDPNLHNPMVVIQLKYWTSSSSKAAVSSVSFC